MTSPLVGLGWAVFYPSLTHSFLSHQNSLCSASANIMRRKMLLPPPLVFHPILEAMNHA